MLKQKDIMDCLPLLASVLGNQYGVTVEIGGSEAYTDGKTIHLPALPLDSEPELITMIIGYTDHESALFHFEHLLADGALMVCRRDYPPQGIRGEDDGTPLSRTSKGVGRNSR